MFVSYRVSTAGQLWWPRHGFMAIIPKLQSTGARSTNHQNRFRNIFHDIFGDIKKCQKNFQIFYLGKKCQNSGSKIAENWPRSNYVIQLDRIQKCQKKCSKISQKRTEFKNVNKLDRDQNFHSENFWHFFWHFLTIFYFLGTVFWHFWTPELGLLFADFFKSRSWTFSDIFASENSDIFHQILITCCV